MNGPAPRLAVWALVLGSALGLARASRVPEPVRPGEPAPDFTLADLDGREHRLLDLRGQIVVLEWTSHLCPAVNGWYRNRQIQQARARLEGRVRWLAVDSSFFARHVAEGIRAWRSGHGLKDPCLLDPDGAVGRRYAAKATPQFMVVDRKGVLAYRGALSDWREGADAGRVRHHLVEAVAALEKGETVAQPETRAPGCTVKYAEPRLLADPAALAAEIFEWSASYTNEGMESAALDLLGGALEAGYPRPSAVLTDPRFRPLRDLARTRDGLRSLLRKHARESSQTLVDPKEPGEPLVVSGLVRGPDGAPVAGALVYVFHTDARGLYSEGGMDESSPRLFAFLKTDAQGRYEYRTIRPGHYPDQDEPVEQHVHLVVSAPGFRERTSRLSFRDDPFWERHRKNPPAWAKEVPPAWAVEVTRGPDGVAHCTHELSLARSDE
jgi:hypothetical protein